VPLVTFAAEQFGPSEFTSAEGLTVNIYNSHYPYGITALQAGSLAGTAIEANGHIGIDAFGSGADGAGVRAHEINATGIDAVSQNAIAVKADGKTIGVEARALGSDLNVGVAVDAAGNKAGVKATSTYGVGVDASAPTAVKATAGLNTTGTVGVSTNGDVAVDASGKSYGVRAYSYEGIGVAAVGKTRAINAYADAVGREGVYAFGDKTGVTAEGKTGVQAKGYAGVGGEFSGSTAAIRLQPATTAGAPGSGQHKRGELYVDSQGSLFLCIADSTTSSPAGTWKKVVLQ